jgi:hypothetical protein
VPRRVQACMPRSATDAVQDVINAAVVDAIVALKEASKGLPNALLRDVNAIRANTAFDDLPPSVRSAVATSVPAAFARLRRDGFVVADAKSLQTAPARQEPLSSASKPKAGHRRTSTRPASKGRPTPSR